MLIIAPTFAPGFGGHLTQFYPHSRLMGLVNKLSGVEITFDAVRMADADLNVTLVVETGIRLVIYI